MASFRGILTAGELEAERRELRDRLAGKASPAMDMDELDRKHKLSLRALQSLDARKRKSVRWERLKLYLGFLFKRPSP